MRIWIDLIIQTTINDDKRFIDDDQFRNYEIVAVFINTVFIQYFEQCEIAINAIFLK